MNFCTFLQEKSNGTMVCMCAGWCTAECSEACAVAVELPWSPSLYRFDYFGNIFRSLISKHLLRCLLVFIFWWWNREPFIATKEPANLFKCKLFSWRCHSYRGFIMDHGIISWNSYKALLLCVLSAWVMLRGGWELPRMWLCVCVCEGFLGNAFRVRDSSFQFYHCHCKRKSYEEDNVPL